MAESVTVLSVAVRKRSPLLGIVVLLSVGTGSITAQSPQFVPAFPLYCHGPLSTSSPTGGKTTTPFKWAPNGAGAVNPGPGECAWADRPARGSEIQPGDGNVICDFSGAMKSVPAGTFVEIGVARDPLVNNCMHLVRYIGKVSPPFSAVPALPPFVRQSIVSLTPAQIASLQHGFQVMMSRPASDPTSYHFQANIHGTTDDATTPQEMQSWNNCEHGSYYFLSWHRMYLYFFDRILRAASGDANLVLPYWNWTDPMQRALPPPFRQPANASNSLYISPPARPAALDAGTASLGAGTVDSSGALADVVFDSAGGSGASFGGQIAPPMQFNGPHGDFESQPHDVVHVALGGLMGDPDTAAQDPIFWLHHANIDRMWKRWLAQGGGRTDATDAAWLNTQFTFYDEAGHAVFLTGAEIVDTVGQLNYRYDDDPSREGAKLRAQAVAPEAPGEKPVTTLAASAPSAESHRVELAGTTARVQVPLTEAASNQVRELVAKNEPRRVFLRLDDIRYQKSSGVYYEVYINPPAAAKLDINSPSYVGNFALFGLKPHAMAGHPQPPPKDIYAEYDVSRVLREEMAGHPKDLAVVLVPRGLFDARGEPLPVPAEVQGTVGGVQIIGR
jgi:hypothetical protein